MNTPKAIFMDIDGTLLSHSLKRVPKSAVEALRCARENGILLFAATGRSNIELEEVACLGDIKLDGFVTLNGAYCYVGNEVVHKNPLPPAAVAAIVERLAHSPFPCIFCEENKLYINMTNDYVRELQKFLGLSIPPVCDPQQALEADIYQLAVFATSKEEEAFLRSLPQTKITRWAKDGFDVVNATTNKWTGILHVLMFLGIKPHEAAAIGDAENDVEMLVNAGYSVAMGNADDNIKKCADFVTSHVDDGGLAKAIKHLLFRNKSLEPRE